MNADPFALALVEHWVRERHTAWYRRNVLRLPPPWTSDEVIASTFFTCPYRELDPGTRWLVAHVNANRPFAPEDAVFNVLMARMALSEAGKAAVGWVRATEFREEAGAVRDRLRKAKDVHTPAYMVRSNAGSKIDSICDSYLLQAADICQRWGEIAALPGREEWVVWISAHLYGIGRFVAFQAMVDLCYPEIAVLPWSNDGWACAGPGSEKGLVSLFGDAENASEKFGWLRDHLNASLTDLPGWTENAPFVPLTRANVQNIACEHSKHIRALSGHRAKRRFRPSEAWQRDRESRGFLRQLELL